MENSRDNSKLSLAALTERRKSQSAHDANSVAYASNLRSRPIRTYTELDEAYEYLNRSIFDDLLPPCLITMQRSRKACGYFSSARFVNASDISEIADEIALNPKFFLGRPTINVLSTLAHEMTHLWQAHFGKPSRGNYHNREFARKMSAIGLVTSQTGLPGGKCVGAPMSHYIREGGAFETVCCRYLAAQTPALFQDRHYLGAPDEDKQTERERQRKADSKTRYVCACCGLKAWAKPNANLFCGSCEEGMQP